MDNATFESEINEHIQRLQDLNKQMGEISKKIGALQEEGRALHGAALEVKGAIDALARLKAKQDEKAAKAKAALTLVDKSLVAADGKTVIADANTPAAPKTEESIKEELKVVNEKLAQAEQKQTELLTEALTQSAEAK